MNDIGALARVNRYAPFVEIVKDGLNSGRSKDAYGAALVAFLAWCDRAGRRFDRATVQNYKASLIARGLAPASVNQHLSAIRKLAGEAQANGFLDPALAGGIKRVEGVHAAGVRTGNWLEREQAQRLINAPDASTLKGLRDRALFAVAIGAGLRRSELAALTFEHVQQRAARWVIVDLVGKRNRTRSIPIPAWTKTALDAWAHAAHLDQGRVFRSMRKGGIVSGEGMTAQAVFDVVKEYGAALGFDIAAHDLRRTYAKLAREGGAALEQIQLSLGHESVQTTERYLGGKQSLTDAPCDHLGLQFK